jgi:hypothetical protein
VARITTNTAAAERTPSGILSEPNPHERILICGEESGVLREQNARERLLLCATK